ncbi:MAG: DUF523 domain-containing protein [Oscillospiraceae bacterium]|nr:DUF523 domain-containing protein [Oscillospiraceae bacterium]
MKILVSSCLLGISCKYSGGHNACEPLIEALRRGGHTIVPVCPEVYGGLPTPRPPAERQGDRVVAQTGADVTEQYRKGAQTALELARLTGCEAAILKANSPSCGSDGIYDGSFSHRVIPGQGVTAELLTENGIPVYSEKNFAELFDDCPTQLP